MSSSVQGLHCDKTRTTAQYLQLFVLFGAHYNFPQMILVTLPSGKHLPTHEHLWCGISRSVSGCSVSPILPRCSLITHERGRESGPPRALQGARRSWSICSTHLCLCCGKGMLCIPQDKLGMGKDQLLMGEDLLRLSEREEWNLGSSLSDSHKPCSLSATCAFQHSFWGHLDSHVGIFLPLTPDAFYFKGSGLLENVLRLFHNFPWFPLSAATFFFFFFICL